jgi:hypothetical protein
MCIMKTWKFVAEILWLFLGLVLSPQSTEQTQDIKQRSYKPVIEEQDAFLERWYSFTLIRPPPWAAWESTPYAYKAKYDTS